MFSFVEGNITSVMTCLVSKVDFFPVLSVVQSIFIRPGEGGDGYRYTVSFVV